MSFVKLMILIFNVKLKSSLIRIVSIIISAPVSSILVLKSSIDNYFSLFKFFIADPINNVLSIGFNAKFNFNVYRLDILRC